MLATVGFMAAAIAICAAAYAWRERPARLWTLGWTVWLLTGIAGILPPPWGDERVHGLLGPLFPAAQLAGVLALTRGRAPSWIFPAFLTLSLIRVDPLSLGTSALSPVVSDWLEPAGTLAAVGILLAAALGNRNPGSLLALAGAMALAAICDGLLPRLVDQPERDPLQLAYLWIGPLVLGVWTQAHIVLQRAKSLMSLAQSRAEAELEKSRERFFALSESAFDLVSELNLNEQFTYVNPRFEEVLGYPRAYFLGKTPADFVHPEDTGRAASFAQEAATSGRALGMEARARRQDGSYIWLEHVAREFVTSLGERRWAMNSRDVSDRKALDEVRAQLHLRLEDKVAEQAGALRESELRFRSLANQVPELISEFDETGHYCFANASFRELLGLDPDSLVGTLPQELIHPDDLARSREGMLRALSEESATRAVHRLRHADGSWRWFDNTGRGYRTANGALHFVSIGRDVTEERELEKERQRQREQMAELQRLESLGLMAGGVAHDFNNLLAVVLGNLSLLEAEPEQQRATRLQRIRDAAEQAEGLTDQMLTYAGRSISELVPLELTRLVTESQELLRVSVSKNCIIDLDLAVELPYVLGDATQLRQVLINLATNASEAFGEGGGTLVVRTGLQRMQSADLSGALGALGGQERSEGDWLVLEVIDDGPGMPEEMRHRIFEPFYTTKVSGRGLGLAAVLGIASSHGGLLKLESAPGRGTSFQLLLPPCEQIPDEAASSDAGKALAGREERILVVDDDEAVREIAQVFLELAGFRVEVAVGGEEALKRIREGSAVDAVLLDLEMPQVSGAEVLRILGLEYPELPVVISSGYKRGMAGERVGNLGRAGFVQKPYRSQELVAALVAVLPGRE